MKSKAKAAPTSVFGALELQEEGSENAEEEFEEEFECDVKEEVEEEEEGGDVNS